MLVQHALLCLLLSLIPVTIAQITQTFTNANDGATFINGAKVTVLFLNVFDFNNGWQFDVVNETIDLVLAGA